MHTTLLAGREKKMGNSSSAGASPGRQQSHDAE